MRLNLIAALVLAVIGIVIYLNHKSNKGSIPTRHPSIKEGGRQYILGPYWYQGRAEINHYKLLQVRYNELHQGIATLIFVTEEFSKVKQVKIDNPDPNNTDVQPVLKLNFIKKFHTGIYPYSMMMSTFMPLGQEVQANAIKTTCSIQEWCGHAFSQLSHRGDFYEYQSFSYFDNESDIREKLPIAVQEDELWNIIRINPTLLPQGQFHILPGSFYHRLKHIPIKATGANAWLNIHSDSTYLYTIVMQDLKRTLKIEYKGEAPYEIISWEEEYPEGGKIMTTTARRVSAMCLDYWNHNKNADSIYRKDFLPSH